MKVTIIIPHYGRDALLVTCMQAIRQPTDPDLWTLVMVDNNANSRGFAAGCNFGASRATTDLLLFLNNDTEPQAGWLPPLVVAFDEASVGAAGAKLLYPDGRVRHAGVDVFLRGGVLQAVHADTAFAGTRRECLAVTRACLAVRRSAFEQFGPPTKAAEMTTGPQIFASSRYDRRAGALYEPRSLVTHHELASGAARRAGVHDNVAGSQEKWFGPICRW